ncbi:hypothetical protein C9E82_18190 [Paracoccus siganidrum]|uniref:Uncharacterized protein n=1 Tax=Paracoccus siganidrum TaxID=1276757 RepID=A0A419A8B1_9RHOB|nr:hypothetical protein D3P05_07965 [Paracoccus siganidrum]RMC30272.1 hypothetical protein C9E82_18190 [Paracoccus siganidrum]
MLRKLVFAFIYYFLHTFMLQKLVAARSTLISPHLEADSVEPALIENTLHKRILIQADFVHLIGSQAGKASLQMRRRLPVKNLAVAHDLRM